MWDALNIVKRAAESTHIVAGGGAAEMEVMTHLRGHARTIEGKQQLVMDAFARAFETIPRQLAENAGFDPTDILNKLRQKHFTDPQGGRWFGVDVVNEGICDTYLTNVWEPVASKMNAIMAATEAACLILSVDQTVRNPQSEQNQMQQKKQCKCCVVMAHYFFCFVLCVLIVFFFFLFHRRTTRTEAVQSNGWSRYGWYDAGC